MREHDPEHEPEHRTEGEPDGRLLRGEERLLQEDVDQGRLVHLRGLAERLEDRPDMRHRRRVDDERPRPTDRAPDPAVELPQADECEQDCDDGGGAGDGAHERDPADAAAEGGTRDSSPGTCDFLSRAVGRRDPL